MSECKISIYLAYGMLLYIFTSIYYLIITYNIGTPFKDSLTQEQLYIKQESVLVRKRVFYTGIIIGVFFICIWRPFKTC
uniref:Uncharacterized protein n=1 Tax=viral metagenome TaxID=1070528 RepID=A0A6C0CWK1_9ZZZZ